MTDDELFDINSVLFNRYSIADEEVIDLRIKLKNEVDEEERLFLTSQLEKAKKKRTEALNLRVAFQDHFKADLIRIVEGMWK